MKKDEHRTDQASRRWKARVEKVVNSRLSHHMANEPDFVAFISKEIAESLDEEPP
ncbi:hypothetical protein [Paracoccus sp. SCSIO 75233]|uniref:hypothetical protein n=1 Tax=Paracoccus sp. SCSIO 75233 TaxID=3017782 RepID=UPI0022F1205D|nr:hypothetical protein [Paracoccus sp. SCSIO 75233]WBU55058.1 hypothetical protein PAF12_16935 [Paracoccus sp. SCSIO 75233]